MCTFLLYIFIFIILLVRKEGGTIANYCTYLTKIYDTAIPFSTSAHPRTVQNLPLKALSLGWDLYDSSPTVTNVSNKLKFEIMGPTLVKWVPLFYYINLGRPHLMHEL